MKNEVSRKTFGAKLKRLGSRGGSNVGKPSGAVQDTVLDSGRERALKNDVSRKTFGAIFNRLGSRGGSDVAKPSMAENDTVLQLRKGKSIEE